MHELTLASAALGSETRVRVLLPAGYDDPVNTGRRYPMLLLLHGASDDQRAWTNKSDVEGRTAGLDLIVVMPDGGRSGFYTDWVQGPQWESYHIGELVPWVDAHYRTVGTREGRAVGGLSMGGFGSMTYASRHPDLFVAAASFSGAVDIADLLEAEGLALELLFNGTAIWGDYLNHQVNWRGHNPPDLATNLRWTALRLRTGTGVACLGDQPAAGTLEAGVFLMYTGFVARLAVAGIQPDAEARLCGTHEWHYWDADLGAWLPNLMGIFADPPPAPAAFDYRSAESAFSVWGWSFTARRPVQEFVDLRAVSRAGLTATGSGVLDVVTPPVYESGRAYRLATAAGGTLTVPVAILPTLGALPPSPGPTQEVIADKDGRLTFAVDLAPPHAADQYTLAADLAELASVGSYFRTVSVTIEPAAAATPVAMAAPIDGVLSNASAQSPATDQTRTLPPTGSTATAAWTAAVGLVLLVLPAVKRRCL
ncbi:MAG: alpha/beta hydrolase [Acidimicrobiales bacterium]